MKWLRDVDSVLRGGATSEEALEKGTGHISITSNVISVIVFAAVFGAFLGLFSVFNHETPEWSQVGAAAAKMPLVFLLTLVVTFPSLYVFSALLGTRLCLGGLLRLVLVAMAVSAVVLASLGPISGFFTITTSSYPFLKLLNGAFGFGGLFIGLGLLARILRRLEAIEFRKEAGKPEAPAPEATAVDETPHPAPAQGVAMPRASREGRSPWGFFRVWMFLYACVWAQMVWILRPFMGRPEMEFAWFRARESNVFLEVLRAIGELFGA